MRCAVAWKVCLVVMGCLTLGAGRAGEAKPSSRKVVVDMINGDRVEGTVLKRDDKHLYLYVGGALVTLDQKQIKSEADAAGDKKEVEDVKSFALYKTGRRSIRDVRALVDDLGQAIVVVKTPAGLGTGWFCNQDGYLITNNHVVAGERSVTVTMFHKKGEGFGKKIFKKVRIIALNDDIDLALLKIEEKVDIPYPQLYLGDSDKVSVGDKVFAVGNPLGLERSTSEGIVSKAARNHGGRLYLQVTAPIAPGNSGGPLFNERGEVVGVVNMGYIFLDGLGFAIPSRYIKEFLDNVEAFAYDADNPNAGTQYMEAPLQATDGSFGFQTSDYIKTGHGVSCLTMADLNGDGVNEVLYADNNKAEIGYVRLRQKEEAEPEYRDYEDINRLRDSVYFKASSIPVSSRVTSLAVADINGDKRADILFLGDVDGLAVLEQAGDGTFKDVRKIERVPAAPRREALRVVDLDNDGVKDIFVLGADVFTVLWDGEEREEFPLAGHYKSVLKNVSFADVNGDNKLDILFFAASRHYAVNLRLQNDQRQFLQDIPIRSHLSGVVRPFENGKGRRFLTLDKGLNRIRELVLAPAGPQRGAEALPASLISVPVDPKSGLTASVELGDLEGHGRTSLVAVDQTKNEFHVIRYTSQGVALTRSPSPTQVSQCRLAVIGKRAALFSLSHKDKIFGISRIDEGKVSFPRPINTEGTVESLKLIKGAGNADAGGRLCWVEKVKGRYQVRAADLSKLVASAYDGQVGSVDVESKTLRFVSDKGKAEDTLSKKPTDLAFADLNRDGKADLIVYWSYSGKESLYLGQGDDVYRVIIKEQTFLEEQKDQPLLTVDMDGDGKEEVLLVRPGFVRVLQVDGKDKLFVSRQFNWAFDTVKHLAVYDRREQRPRFIAVAEDQARIVELDRAKNEFKLIQRLDLSGIDAGKVCMGDVDGNGEADIIILGKGVINVFLHRVEVHAVESRVVMNAKLDHFKYWNLYPADLDGDGRDEVLVFDSKKAMFEVYRPAADGQLRVVLRQRLFEKTIFQRSQSGSLELPEEVVVGDVDGDKKPDFVCILQDRVALYLQAKR